MQAVPASQNTLHGRRYLSDHAIRLFWSVLPDNPDFNTPCRPPEFDNFSPPKRPLQVHCLHCGLRYSSRLIAWGRKVGMQIAGGAMDPALWWCPTPGCDGGGYQHDIFPLSKMGGKGSKPLTRQLIADWETYKASLPTRSKKRKRVLSLDALHCAWLIEALADEGQP
jgi:hypothetical protein